MRLEGHTVYSMSAAHAPAARMQSGGQITLVTRDCFNNQLLDETSTMDSLDWDAINPAIGPVFIEGAMPGDVLKVKIEAIQVGPMGTMSALPDNGVLGTMVEKNVIKRIPVIDNVAYFSEKIRIPCSPMIGVIGVAPAAGAVSCGEPGNHGGNMDNTKIRTGAVLYLPVFHEGALLALGDVHACMGDGEIMVSGLEIPAEVTVTVDVLKQVTIENPMLEDEESCYTIASHADIEQAVFMAVKAMTEIVSGKLELSFEEAGMLLSAMGNLQFCQVVDPKRTVRMEMKKTVLKNLF